MSKYGWHDNRLTAYDITVVNDLSLAGDLTFGDAVVDSFLIKGRVSTGTVAGAALDIGATYSSAELMEMRCTVSAWTGVLGSFKGYYFNTTATAGNASYGLRCMEIIGTANITSGTTGLGSLQAFYVEANLKHGAASWTLGGYGAAIEATTCIYQGAGTLTVTNDFPAIKIRVQGANGAADYTKFNGISIYARDGDSASRVFGDAISIELPDDAFTSTWTNGIYLAGNTCANGLIIGTSGTKMTMSTYASRAIEVYTTCASTDTGNSSKSVVINTTLTGAGGVGRAMEVNLTTNVALGGWANAFKANVDCSTSGKATGLLSGINVDFTLPASNPGAGSFACYEANMICPSSYAGTNFLTIMNIATSGTTKAAFDTGGLLFDITGVTMATTKFFQANTAIAASHALKCRINGTLYYVMLTSTGA